MNANHVFPTHADIAVLVWFLERHRECCSRTVHAADQSCRWAIQGDRPERYAYGRSNPFKNLVNVNPNNVSLNLAKYLGSPHLTVL